VLKKSKNPNTPDPPKPPKAPKAPSRPKRAPAPPAMLGLDIGSATIKVAEARSGKDGITITALGLGRIPDGVVENDVILDPAALGASLKTLISESGVRCKKVVSSIAGLSNVVVRVVDVPRMTDKELGETMKWEVEKLSFSPNDDEVDFAAIDLPGADPDAQNMNVLLAVARRDLVANHVAALTAAGLQPVAIDIEPLAEGRSMIQASGGGEMEQVAAIINIGSSKTELGIFEKGVLTYPRPPIEIAGIHMTREVSEALGQTMEQAEITKKEYAVVDLDGFAAQDTTDDFFGGGSAQDSEPTSFGTSFGPDATTAAAPEPGGFQNTVDGPVFDVPDGASGPTFDVGEPSPAPGPSFDFGGEDTTISPSFDLGGGEPTAQASASPVFDLEDEEEPAAVPDDEPAAPSFDLSDAEVVPSSNAAAPVPVGANAVSGTIGDAVFHAISGVLMDLATELRRSIEYYGTMHSSMPEKAYLCGGAAKIPHLDAFLSRELGMPVEIGNPMKSVKVKVTGISDQHLREIAPTFSVSIGLAIRDMVG